MATPRPHVFKLYFASKDLSGDGDALPQRVVSAAADAKQFSAAELTQAGDFWNGAIGWFAADTATAALRGIFFHVRESTFDGAVMLAKNLPAAPVTGDVFYLACGGGVRSSQELFGMTVAGRQQLLHALLQRRPGWHLFPVDLLDAVGIGHIGLVAESRRRQQRVQRLSR